ncbi:hypothetical protein [Fodinicola acaciae]|uniref:hypothetical protein n=1 Tax=Fodinicola acaciae TaxID=2681555 RepID=UPI0013D14B1D|nr:hypothetical protein [Fodinicola acaciae]
MDGWKPTHGAPFVRHQSSWLNRVRSELNADAVIPLHRDRDLAPVRAAVERFANGISASNADLGLVGATGYDTYDPVLQCH